MSPKRALLTILAALAASLILSLAIGFAQDSEPAPADPPLGVEWDYRPTDLADLTAETPAIVLAEVDAVREGEPLEAPPAEEGGAPFSFPTERVDLRVTSTLEGQTPERFTLFKLGAGTEHPAGDPAYAVGERYLLFVRRRLNTAGTAPSADDTWLAVAPDGRLERLSSGRLDAQIAGPVARALDGRTVAQAEERIEAAEGGQ